MTPVSIMAEDNREKPGRGLQIDQMPPTVKRLIDAMVGIDPEFKIEDWLVKKASEDLEMLESDIAREKLQLEQRIHRLEAISKRLSPEDMREIPKAKQICLIALTFLFL